MAVIYRKKRVAVLVIVGLAWLAIKLLLSSRFDHSALLYVGVPYLISIALVAFVKPFESEANNSAMFFVQLCLWSLVIMLSTSVLLGEGFICVLMFMPIYFGILFLIALVSILAKRATEKGKNKHHIQIIPALVIISSFEGAVPQFEFNRDYSVTREILVSASPTEIQAQLQEPIDLNVDRHWLLEIFPMPTNVEAGTLSAGDVHNIDFVYHRWFVTNTHRGSMQLELSEVNEHYIRTSFVHNSSYIKNYMELKGTEIHFEPVSNGETRVSLTIHYQRLLDPVWYFGPLQSYAVGEVADLLLTHLFVPEKG